jgi:hypothetical protein
MPNIISPICVADGPALTGSAPQLCTPPDCPVVLDRGYWTPGKRWRLRASGIVSTVVKNAAGDRDELPGSMRFDVRFGGVVVWDSGEALLDPLAAVASKPWSLDVELACRVAGSASTTLIGSGTLTSSALKGVSATAQPSAGASAALPWGTPPVVGAAFNSFLPLQAEVFFTNPSPRGSLTVQQYTIEEL